MESHDVGLGCTIASLTFEAEHVAWGAAMPETMAFAVAIAALLSFAWALVR